MHVDLKTDGLGLGEVELTIDDETYKMRMDVNTLCKFQQLYSTPEKETLLPELLRKVVAGSIVHIRSFIWLALKVHRPEITEEEAGVVMQKAGGVIGLDRLTSSLAASTQPDPRDLAELQKVNPPQAQAKGRVN